VKTKPLVRCYSGARYAERPVAFQYADQELTVAEIERSWRDPAGICFIVQASDGRRFRLDYHEQADRWSVELLGKRRSHR
jgi:hypothetical protein